MSELKAEELEHIAYMQTIEIQSLTARIAELELGLNNQTVHSNTLQKILTEKLDRIAELEHDLTNKEIEYTDLWDDALAFQSRIAELEAAQRWIPVSERLPDKNDIVKECNNVATPIDVALRKRIAKLEEKQRWIPVSERMPDNWESVLTIDISKSTQDVVSAFYNPETSLWEAHFGDLWVTHWMPLPEPPIVYGKVCEE